MNATLSHRNIQRGGITLAGLVVAAILAMSGMAQAQDQARTHKSWAVNCITENDGRNVCAMRQRVLDNNGQDVLVMAVGPLPGNNTPGLLVVLPLGVSLTHGVRIKIDDNDAIDLPVQRCLPQGCRIEGFIEPAMVDQLKSGNKATIAFLMFDSQDRPNEVQVDVSLAGFTAAFNDVFGS